MTQSFTSNPINVAPASSGWDFLDSATASASATLDFTSSIDSTYYMYAFVIENLAPATDNTQFRLVSSTDGGSTWDSSGYLNSGAQARNTGLVTQYGASAVSILLCQSIGNSTNENGSGIVYLINPSGTNHTSFSSKMECLDLNGNIQYMSMVGRRTSAADVDAIRFLMSTGNIASGTIKMYGCCKPA